MLRNAKRSEPIPGAIENSKKGVCRLVWNKTKLVRNTLYGSITCHGSFHELLSAAGWEKDDSGIWHYYDSDDDMAAS